MKARFGLIRVLCHISAALSCKVHIILALESAKIIFILYIHLSLDVNFSFNFPIQPCLYCYLNLP